MRGLATVTLATTLLLSACAATQTRDDLDRLYGKERVHDRVIPGRVEGNVDYWSEVQPILESRCVVCHGCYDAPCQVKLDAVEGLDRGAHKEKVFEPSRLLAMSLTRLFEDASSTAEWREKGFHPVLNERDDTREANLNGSVLYSMLELKKRHPLPDAPLLEGFDLALDRDQTCPTIDEFPAYAEKHPTWGMPYGLPSISEREFQTITQWIEEGARFTARPTPTDALRREVATWEKLLNQDDLKSQLVSRYVYEHLFMAHLHFPDVATQEKTPEFFELVRSRTPPGTPVDRISSRRPFEDPKVARVYYRIEPLKTTVLVKNHLPYALDARRVARYRELLSK